MHVYLKTDKDQFLIPVWNYVNESYVTKLAIPEIIRKQPLERMNNYSDAKGYRIFGLTTASSSLDPSQLCMTEQELVDTVNNDDLSKAVKELLGTPSYGYSSNNYKKIMRVKKGLLDGSLKICTFDPLFEFSQSECVALFCTLKDGSEGYIGRDGSLGTLSKALTFESEKDALRDINRRNMYSSYKSMQTVRLNINVSGIGSKIDNAKAWRDEIDFSKTSIYAIDALAQRNKIKDALKQASLEQLREAYESLSGQVWEENNSSKPASKKKM